MTQYTLPVDGFPPGLAVRFDGLTTALAGLPQWSILKITSPARGINGPVVVGWQNLGEIVNDGTAAEPAFQAWRGELSSDFYSDFASAALWVVAQAREDEEIE